MVTIGLLTAYNMKRSKEKPPVFDKLHEKFGITWNGNVVITYGDTFHCNSDMIFPEHLNIHEATHSRQQAEMGVEKWWEKYLEDPEFRKEQEMEAYVNQCKHIDKTENNRAERFRMKFKLMKDFSSSMYGNIISPGEASKIMNL